MVGLVIAIDFVFGCGEARCATARDEENFAGVLTTVGVDVADDGGAIVSGDLGRV